MTSVNRGAVLLALFAAMLWGIWWGPIRWLEEAGLAGAWAGFGMTVGCLPLLAGLCLVRDRSRLSGRAAAGALLVGAAVTLYGTALVYTDVVRAVLLFYLAPAWSTAIECLFLGRRWNWRSGLALGLSFAGILFIFRADFSGSAWGGGDLMALLSGLCWSAGAALIFLTPAKGAGTTGAASARRLALITGVGALVTGGLAVAFGEPAPMPAMPVLAEAAPLMLLYGVLYLAPILLITMWGALRLPPATLSFLLTAEIVSGVGSSAIFLDEPFGAIEVLGALLVGTGALVEVISPGAPKPKGEGDVEPAEDG